MSAATGIAAASAPAVGLPAAVTGFGGIGLGGLLGASIVSSLASSAFSTGGSLFSSSLNYKYNKKLQDRAFRHQIRMYKNQHQWAVDDLRKAGLNPILATHSASSMPSASAASVSVPDFGQNFDFDNLIDYLRKEQGFSSSRDMQKFARENHEVDLATKEADLAIRELTADNIRADIAFKTANSALQMLDVDRRSRDWYKRFEDLRDIRNTYKGSTFFQRVIDDAEGYLLRSFMNLNETQTNSAFRISKPASRSRFTNYKYKYHKN